MQRGNRWVMSGKAMQDAAPPARAAVRELWTTMEESEGHCALSLRPLLLPHRTALAEPKGQQFVISRT